MRKPRTHTRAAQPADEEPVDDGQVRRDLVKATRAKLCREGKHALVGSYIGGGHVWWRCWWCGAPVKDPNEKK